MGEADALHIYRRSAAPGGIKLFGQQTGVGVEKWTHHGKPGVKMPLVKRQESPERML